ncbi:SMP-30/gluconolactonase/LRE family protein [Chloroflexota bacterium]
MKGWAKILIGVAAALGLLAIYLLFWPVPMDPVAWTPPEPPTLTGTYEPNNRLAAVERLGEGACIGPEDVVVDTQDRIYSGMQNGRILRFKSDGTSPEVFADTGGRPLGLHFDRDGNLVVADAYKGLLSISPDGAIKTLSTEESGFPFRLTDDVDIAADGTIYFSDASFKFPIDKDMLDMLEHRPNGRLLAYDPRTKTTRLLLDELYFANGVAVSPDQSFILVAETGMARVKRYWLAGPKKGKSDIFIDDLPGYPDNISSNGKDTFWLALGSVRDPGMEGLLPHPFLRKIIVRLPQFLLPDLQPYGFVLGLDLGGRVVYNLQNPSGESYSFISSAQEHQGMLYLGSIKEDAIGRLSVPERY